MFLRVRPVISERFTIAFYETAGFKAVSTRGGRVRVRAAVPWRSGAAAGASTVVPRSSDKSNLDETRPPSFHDRVGFECFVVFGIQRFTPSPFTPPPRLRAPRAHLDTSSARGPEKKAPHGSSSAVRPDLEKLRTAWTATSGHDRRVGRGTRRQRGNGLSGLPHGALIRPRTAP